MDTPTPDMLAKAFPEPVPGLEVLPSPTPEQYEMAGRLMEWSAHALSASRAIGGIVLARYIADTPHYHSWPLAIGYSGLALTDALDGKAARKGRELRGIDENKPSPLGAYGDQLSDKVLNDLIMSAIAIRAFRNGHAVYGTAVATAAGITIARDGLTTIDRVIASFQGIDARAQKSGKLKTIVQGSVVASALTPPADSLQGRLALGAAFLATAKQSVDSGLDLHGSFQQQRQERRRKALLEAIAPQS